MVNPWQYIIQEIDENYCCIICDLTNMHPKPILDHVNGERHREAIEQHADNVVVQGNNKFYCNVCGCLVLGYQNVYKHLIGQKHEEYLKEWDSEIDGDFIVPDGDFGFYCIICGCYLNSRAYAEYHKEGRNHEEALNVYGDDISFRENNNFHCHLCNCRISGDTNVYQHLMGRRHQEKLNESESESSEESWFDPTTNPWFFIMKEDKTLYNCFICDEIMPSNILATDHVNGKEHSNAMQAYGDDIDVVKNIWRCNLCECEMRSYKNVYKHLVGQRHQDNMED